jgi:Fe-S cluster biogenesis protein NfuA
MLGGLNRLLRRSIFIQTESTPNMNAIKFVTGSSFFSLGDSTSKGKTFEFSQAKASSVKSPLAALMLQISGVENVLIADEFVTVCKDSASDWKHIKPEVYAILSDWHAQGKPAINQLEANEGKVGIACKEEDKQVVEVISDLIDTRIRPSIQADGGDLEFLGYADGVVKLKLQGSCKSCSSSVVTLKLGVESMLKHYVPEVISVEQVAEGAQSEEKYFKETEQKIEE